MSLQVFLLWWHLAVIAMGVGLSFSNFMNTALARNNGEEMQKGLALQRRTIARIGDGVIALIWLTGLLLLWQRGFDDMGWPFRIKIVFVLLLTIAHARARMLGEKMRREGHRNLLFEQGSMIMAVWFLALGAILAALMTFRG